MRFRANKELQPELQRGRLTEAGKIQSDLAITNLDIPDTLLYRTLRNPNGAHQQISPCYNGRTCIPDRTGFSKYIIPATIKIIFAIPDKLADKKKKKHSLPPCLSL